MTTEVMAHLEIKTAQGTKHLKLGDEPVSIGRQPDNALVLADELTSRHHCVIEPWEGGFRIRDLGSANGTKLNDQKISSDLLDNGDVVRIGTVEVRFIDPEQLAPRRRQNVPDFEEAAQDNQPELHSRDTLDVDLHAEVLDAPTNYERKLRAIIDSAQDKPSTDTDISLVDNRCSTLHQA